MVMPRTPQSPSDNQRQLTPPPKLDKLVGLAMLVAATVVFLYYSVWTLLMVRYPSASPSPPPSALTAVFLPLPALCRLGPPPPKLLPPTRLGNPHPRHPHPRRFRRRRVVPQRRHDPQQQEEGRQGQGGGQEEVNGDCVVLYTGREGRERRGALRIVLDLRDISGSP